RKVYNCSKFLGLPDVVKAVIPNCPPLLDVDIDINKGQREFFSAIYAVARPFTWNPFKVNKAAQAAWQTHLAYKDLMRREALTPSQAIARIFGEEEKPEGPGAKAAFARGDAEREPLQPQCDMAIAVIGHPYTIYDEYINHRLLHRLQGMGVRVLTTEMAAAEDLNAGVARLVGRPYWTFEDEVVGAGGHYLHQSVDGVISVVAFGCGPDSVMIDLLQRYAKRQHTIPYMSLTIDEHTAETGLVTRLEAFRDMLVRRKRRRACA
ncbi:MAG: acyl-CoA dehydratase activase-related protein, partial [Chloroflexota bacterium]|nr:acyl-CoA dehydratase activase-related protein [Chloroflexota bacterium]